MATVGNFCSHVPRGGSFPAVARITILLPDGEAKNGNWPPEQNLKCIGDGNVVGRSLRDYSNTSRPIVSGGLVATTIQDLEELSTVSWV